MPFFIHHNDQLKKVISAQSSLSAYFGGHLNINWGIEAFGFGQYLLSKKENTISIANECTGKKTVTAVIKQAFDEMLYSENTTLETVSEDLNYEKTAKYFYRDPKYCKLWMLPHRQSEDEQYVYQSYFVNNNFEEIKITFDKNKFPSENQDNFTISDLLQESNWADMFVKSSKVNWQVIHDSKTFQHDGDENCEFVDMLWDKDSQEMHFLWKNQSESGFIAIKNHSYLPLVEIKTFGKNKKLIFNLIDSMMVHAQLEDK